MHSFAGQKGLSETYYAGDHLSSAATVLTFGLGRCDTPVWIESWASSRIQRAHWRANNVGQAAMHFHVQEALLIISLSRFQSKASSTKQRATRFHVLLLGIRAGKIRCFSAASLEEIPLFVHLTGESSMSKHGQNVGQTSWSKGLDSQGPFWIAFVCFQPTLSALACVSLRKCLLRSLLANFDWKFF